MEMQSVQKGESPSWAIILELIYEKGVVRHPDEYPDREWSDGYYLEEESSLSDLELDMGIQYAESVDPIKRTDRPDMMGLELTEKGFDVAHERELRQRQQELLETQNSASRHVALFTVVLGLATLPQAAAAILRAPTPQIYFILVASIGILAIAYFIIESNDWSF